MTWFLWGIGASLYWTSQSVCTPLKVIFCGTTRLLLFIKFIQWIKNVHFIMTWFLSGLPGSLPNADQFRSKLQHWSQMLRLIVKITYISIPIIANQCWSISLNSDQQWSHWKAFRINARIFIGIDPHWALIEGVYLVFMRPFPNQNTLHCMIFMRSIFNELMMWHHLLQVMINCL